MTIPAHSNGSHATLDIGPAHTLLDQGSHTRRISVPVALIGAPAQSVRDTD